MLHVGRHPFDAAQAESVRRPGQHLERLEQAVEQHRLKGVELQLSRLHRHGDGHVVARNQEGRLGDHFGNDRVDLAGHDGGAMLAGGQLQLLNAAAGTAGQQAHVVGDLGHHQGAVLYRRGDGGKAVRVLGGIDQVVRRLQGLPH